MVKVIVGLKGSGKTKKLVELVSKAVNEEQGDVICIEKDRNLTFDIPYQARLIYASDYQIGTFEFMKGFISGLYAGNYDITHIFIDSLTKIIPSDASDRQVEDFLNWLAKFGEDNNIKFVVTISADASLATEGVKQYF